MSTKQPKVSDRIKLVKNDHVRSILKEMGNYLTDLALRAIVEYILDLEGTDGTKTKRSTG